MNLLQTLQTLVYSVAGQSSSDAARVWERVLDPEVLVFTVGCTLGALAIICHHVHKLIKFRAQNELKQQMIDRGMSVEEIERVIAAGDSSDEEEKKGKKPSSG